MLEVDRLSRRFGEHVAADQVSFRVAPGELTGFVGGNGAGKTTTMRMIMGILAPHGGEARWHGEPLTAAHRRRFGYMPEERGLYPKQRVLDQLVYLGRLHGMSQRAARDGASAHLERFGLAARSKDKLESLSLGNQQRVQVTAAVMIDPDALILDEPFSGLDPAAVDSMADVLREHAANGVPVLFSSHQLDLVEQLCDRLVILADGKVVADGRVADLRRRGPSRHRLVLDADAGWVRAVPGVHALDVDGPTAVVELLAEDSAHRLLSEALRRGTVQEFSEQVPPLSTIYREVAA